jgi:hypothetical protein
MPFESRTCGKGEGVGEPGSDSLKEAIVSIVAARSGTTSRDVPKTANFTNRSACRSEHFFEILDR